ncbi:MAG: ElaA protein [Bacteroidia bacterium]|jgi:ElaA protein
MGEVIWNWKRFEELTTSELYEFMVLRQEVFVVEQSCHYLDADGRDVNSFHLMGYQDGKMVAYARIVKPGFSYAEVAVGRVVTAQSVRGQGIGITLMNKALGHIEEEFGKVPVRLSAQTYLLKYYEKYGFASTGKEYFEDEIPHTEMLRP